MISSQTSRTHRVRCIADDVDSVEQLDDSERLPTPRKLFSTSRFINWMRSQMTEDFADAGRTAVGL